MLHYVYIIEYQNIDFFFKASCCLGNLAQRSGDVVHTMSDYFFYY
jgi:hypothetical protein